MKFIPLTAAIKQRFAFRPEIDLLYDRFFGIEHRLNKTAAMFVLATFETLKTLEIASVEDIATQIAQKYNFSKVLVSQDLQELWKKIFTAPKTVNSVRRSGAPVDWASVDLPFPLVIEIELTKICNWRCDFCYNVWKVFDNYDEHILGKHLPLETVKQVLDEAAANQGLRIRFSGGEPTLHPQFNEIITYAGQLGFDIELFTNGSRMTQERAEFLAANNVRIMLISLHGDEKTHTKLARHRNAYNHSIDAMRYALKAGIKVVAESLVCEDNLQEMEEMVKKLNELGVHDISFMPYVPYSSDDQHTPITLKLIAEVIEKCKTIADEGTQFRVPCAPKHCLEAEPTPIENAVSWEFDNHCAAGILWASVSFDGRLRHCPHSNVFAGTVEEGLKKVWQERILPTVRSVVKPDNESCNSCSQFAVCKGGCHLDKVTSYHDSFILLEG